MDKIDPIVRALYYVWLSAVQHNDSEAWNFILDTGDVNTATKHTVSEQLVKLLKQRKQ